MPRTAVGIVVGVLLATPAYAQLDHLECLKVKDSTRKTGYTTAIGGLAPAQGCVVSVPAKLMCVPTAQPQLAPFPPGAQTGPAAGAFLCYKVRCRRNALASSMTVTDEFGQRLVTPRRSRLLCAPVSGSTTTTSTTLLRSEVSSTTTHAKKTTTTAAGQTTTSVTNRTTTIKTSTTTTLPGAHCYAPGTSCGSCGNGACQIVRPTGQTICAFQECEGICQSTADCFDGRYCIGTSNTGYCCAPCW